jgi:hypothetical protein
MKPRKTSAPPAKKASPKMVLAFDAAKEVRAIARERVGIVKPSQEIVPKQLRKKPKHKKPVGEE